MIINSSHVGMESERSYSSISKDAVAKTTYTASGKTGFNSFLLSSNSEREYNGKLVESETKESSEDTVNDESAGQTLQEQMDEIRSRMRYVTSVIKNNAINAENELQNKLANACLNYLLRLLFGKDFEDNFCKYSGSYGKTDFSEGSSGYEFQAIENKIITLGSVYEEYHSFEENENTSFSTTGTVVTSDGREIEFNLDLEMSRSFVEYAGIKKESLIQFTDPLVINLDGNIADVSDQKFYFDIDCDGEEDKISKLGINSGFLAIDKNNDGIINDGSELFGAKSGDGFADLSEYDKDNNGWIDEADDIFDKLIIWTKDAEGNDKYLSLKDAGVGAIYTGKASTKFSMMSGINKEGMNRADTLENALDKMGEVNAMIKSTGIFLFENGNVGTVQQLDMAKEVS